MYEFGDGMYLDIYKIEGTINADQNPWLLRSKYLSNFQERLDEFKNLLKDLVKNNESRTYSLVMEIIFLKQM